MARLLPTPIFEALGIPTHAFPPPKDADDDDGLEAPTRRVHGNGAALATVLNALAANPIVYGMSQDLMLLWPTHVNADVSALLFVCELIQRAGGCRALRENDAPVHRAIEWMSNNEFQYVSLSEYAARIRLMCARLDPMSPWLAYTTWYPTLPASGGDAPPLPLDVALTTIQGAHEKLDTATVISLEIARGEPILIRATGRVQVGALTFQVLRGVYMPDAHRTETDSGVFAWTGDTLMPLLLDTLYDNGVAARPEHAGGAFIQFNRLQHVVMQRVFQ